MGKSLLVLATTVLIGIMSFISYQAEAMMPATPAAIQATIKAVTATEAIGCVQRRVCSHGVCTMRRVCG